MPGWIKIIRAIPGSSSLHPILRDFCRAEGTVTSFSDQQLYVIRSLVDENLPIQIEMFGKIVRDVLSMAGEPVPMISTSGQTLESISLACSELPEDSPLHRWGRFPGAQRAIQGALDLLEDATVDPDRLEAILPKLSPLLRQKAAGLVQIARHRDEIAATLGRQSAKRLIARCLEAVPERDGALERLLVFGGSDICELKLRWLRWAAEHGTQITLVLDRHATGAPLFANVEGVVEALGGDVSDMGSGNSLTNDLFAPTRTGGAPIKVSVVSAADPLSEAEWAVRGCLAAEDPSNCAIHARNLEEYAPLIEAAAKRLGLPVRIFRRAPLMANAYCRLTLAIIQFCAGSDVRALIPILRSSYMGLSPREHSELSQAIVECYKKRSGAWTALRAMAAERGTSLSWLSDLLDWREMAIKGTYEARQWMGQLQELVRARETMPWSTAGLNQDATMRERDIRARNRMEQLLNDAMTVANVARPIEWGLARMAQFCERVWRDADVSIPDSDGITVTSDVRTIASAKTLFVLGMVEGVFPRRRTEDPVLSDSDLAEISIAAGVRLPNSFDASRMERDEFYRVCAAAGDRIVLSYPETDDQRESVPAFYIEIVKELTSPEHLSLISQPRTQMAPPSGECTNDADRKLRAALDAPKLSAPPVALTTDEARRSIIPPEDQPFTPNELRDALECPFRYVARHRLNLRPRTGRVRWTSLTNLPQKVDLPIQPDEGAAESALIGALEDQLESFFGELPEWEVQILRSGGRKLIADWLKREFKARKIWSKQETQARPAFGAQIHGKMPYRVNLEGRIPATSRLGSYQVGHMFSTSIPESNPSDGDKLFYGVQLLAMYKSSRDVALEIDSLAGERCLVVLGRAEGTRLTGEISHGLSVRDLAQSDIPRVGIEEFFRSVKALLNTASSRIREGDMDPLPSEVCGRCDYGELCRRSAQYSDGDDTLGNANEPEAEA